LKTNGKEVLLYRMEEFFGPSPKRGCPIGFYHKERGLEKGEKKGCGKGKDSGAGRSEERNYRKILGELSRKGGQNQKGLHGQTRLTG